MATAEVEIYCPGCKTEKPRGEFATVIRRIDGAVGYVRVYRHRLCQHFAFTLQNRTRSITIAETT